MLLLLLLVHNGDREMLKYALRVPFCIALPLYCVHEQPLIDKSRIRNFWSSLPQDLDQKSGALSENRIPHPKCSFFLRGLLLHKQNWRRSSCSCFVGTQERVLRPLDPPHSGPKHFLLNRGKFEGVFLGTCQKNQFLIIDFFFNFRPKN